MIIVEGARYSINVTFHSITLLSPQHVNPNVNLVIARLREEREEREEVTEYLGMKINIEAKYLSRSSLSPSY